MQVPSSPDVLNPIIAGCTSRHRATIWDAKLKQIKRKHMEMVSTKVIFCKCPYIVNLFSWRRSKLFSRDYNFKKFQVYAMNWTPYGIKIWHFPRSAIPDNIKEGVPDPETWSKPLAKFHGLCDFNNEFREQMVNFIKCIHTNL